MDLLTLPPEVTSALIHAGPGAGPMLEAAAAWESLAAELESTVDAYSAAVSTLTESWTGPSSSGMLEAVQPYLTWMRNTAHQAHQTAASAQDAASAITTAVASVVPPPVVGANRARLAQLLATNLLGVNLPAIAQVEDEYQAMWAANSAALSRYQASSAQATAALPRFLTPDPIVNPAGVSAQTAATQAAAAPAAPGLVQSIFAPNTDATGTGLAGLLNLFSGSSQSSFGSFLNSNILTTGVINSIVGSGFPINLLSLGAQVQAAQSLGNIGGDVGQGLSEGEAIAGGAAEGLPGAFGAAGLSAEPAAAMSVGVSLGKLTAPPAVVGLLPGGQVPVQLASTATPMTAQDAGFPLPPLMPPPITAGSGWRKRKDPKYEDLEIGREIKGKVVRPPPSAG